MYKYLLLNAVFLIFAAGIILLCHPRHDPPRLFTVLAGVVLLTAIFDPFLVGLGIVQYRPQALLGIKWFGAPIEDFAYALVAATLMPALWQRLRRRPRA